MWFDGISKVENPGPKELKGFTIGVETFLDFILKEKTDFAFLWEDEPALWKLAQDIFKHDIRPGAKKMRDAIDKIPHTALDQHGLRNRPLNSNCGC